MKDMVDRNRLDIENAFRFQLFSSSTASVVWPSVQTTRGQMPPAQQFEVVEPASLDAELLLDVISRCRDTGRYEHLAEADVQRVYDGVATALGASDWRDLVKSPVRAAFMTRHPTRIYLFDELFPGIVGDVPTVDHAVNYNPQKLPAGATDTDAVERFLDFFQSLPSDGQLS